MKNKQMVIGALSLLLLSNGVAYGDTANSISDIQEVTVLNSDKNNLELNYTAQSYDFIERFQATILDVGNGYINMYSNLGTTTDVDSVEFKVYLQEKNGSSYTTIDTWNRTASERYGSYEFDEDYRIISGHEYRIKVIAMVSKGSTTETDTVTTSYITVE